MVRAGPADRRHFLDETLAVVDPKAARAAEETEKVLRQRAALLRNVGRTLNAEAATTLDVWDVRLAEAGTRWSRPGSTWWPNWPPSPPSTTRGWPARRPGSASTTSGRGAARSSTHSRPPGPRTSSAGCRRWDPTGTSSS